MFPCWVATSNAVYRVTITFHSETCPPPFSFFWLGNGASWLLGFSDHFLFHFYFLILFFFFNQTFWLLWWHKELPGSWVSVNLLFLVQKEHLVWPSSASWSKLQKVLYINLGAPLSWALSLSSGHSHCPRALLAALCLLPLAGRLSWDCVGFPQKEGSFIAICRWFCQTCADFGSPTGVCIFRLWKTQSLVLQNCSRGFFSFSVPSLESKSVAKSGHGSRTSHCQDAYKEEIFRIIRNVSTFFFHFACIFIYEETKYRKQE